MTPAEFGEFLRVARDNGCARFKVGDVEATLVLLGQAAQAPVAADGPSVTPTTPATEEEHWADVERQLWATGLPA